MEVQEEHAHPGVGSRVSRGLERPAVDVSPPAVHSEPGHADERDSGQGDKNHGLPTLRAQLEEAS